MARATVVARASASKLSSAAWELQTWLSGYRGVSNLVNDLRLGKPQFTVSLLPGALASGLSAEQLAQQLRAAYQGIKIDDIYRGRESYEINVRLDTDHGNALRDFEHLTLFNQDGIDIPLSAIARIDEKREFSQITRINHRRTAWPPRARIVRRCTRSTRVRFPRYRLPIVTRARCTPIRATPQSWARSGFAITRTAFSALSVWNVRLS